MGSDWIPRPDPTWARTRVLRRHGFSTWEELYPRRQRAVMEALLELCAEATADPIVQRTLEMAVFGAAEMAGYPLRWDRWYLKCYQAMAGHRFNFTTFTVEPNVWGSTLNGRGTVCRRLHAMGKAASWLRARAGKALVIEGPLSSDVPRTPWPGSVDVRVVLGSSDRLVLRSGVVHLVVTDPPYHDDVQYSELSLPFRA